MNRRVFSFAVEASASVLTVAGMWLGSTTLPGASAYLVSMVFWYVLTFQKRLWGLMPLNIASTVVAMVNLYGAVHR